MQSKLSILKQTSSKTGFNPVVAACAISLLIGIGVGYILPTLESRPQVEAVTQSVTGPLQGRVGFARAACLGTVLGDGKWGVVYDGC